MYYLIFTSLSKKALNSYKKYLAINFTRYKIRFNSFTIPKKIKRVTLLKSPHVNKKSKETFKVINYRIGFKLKTNKFCLLVLRNNLPKFIHLKWKWVNIK